jgi:hypothetical protein
MIVVHPAGVVAPAGHGCDIPGLGTYRTTRRLKTIVPGLGEPSAFMVLVAPGQLAARALALSVERHLAAGAAAGREGSVGLVLPAAPAEVAGGVLDVS